MMYEIEIQTEIEGVRTYQHVRADSPEAAIEVVRKTHGAEVKIIGCTLLEGEKT